jgi:4'-phosphopantetheinyl transferase
MMLGFDIELNDPARDIIALAETGFQGNEQRWLTQQPDESRIAAFYELWSTREALYKLMSSLGREMPSSSLNSVGEHDTSRSWHRRAFTHQGLTAVVCSDKWISKLEKVDLAGLTPADLLGPPSLDVNRDD